jgi:cobalt-zinc-cadmium efflux system outer membrane protein
VKRTHAIAVAAAAIACSLFEFEAHAGTLPCAPVTRANLVPCALTTSLAAKAERQGLEAAAARQEAARPVLPANPVLALSGAQRRGPGAEGTVLNWSATLSQEIEIAGQREARKRAADTERLAQEKTVAITEREVAAAAFRAYFEALAAREEESLGGRLEALTARVALATRSAADQGLVSGVDADVAEAAHLRAVQEHIAAARHARQATAALAMRMGLDPSRELAVEGPLSPIAGLDAFLERLDPQAIEERPEVQALEAQGRAHEARADMYRRARVPNPTLSLFVQNDGFNERVIGLGLQLPIPLPQPLGRTHAGEIAEAEALARRSSTQAEQARRAIRLDIESARATYDALRAEAALYGGERLGRAEAHLGSIASEIEAGRLTARDAIVAQQALLDVLRAGLATRRDLCLASVDLAWAAGFPLERGAP